MSKVTRTAADAAKVTGFSKILTATGQGVIDKRAALIVKQTETAMNDHLQELQRQDAELEFQELNLTDLSVETNDSLRPGANGYNAKKWVAELTDIRYQRAILADKIAIAEELKEDFFTEIKEEAPAETK